MTNFIKRIVGGQTNQQSACCGVEIKEVSEDNHATASDSCCGTDTSASNASSCCSTDAASNAACCGG